jgi:phage-related protein
MPSTGHGIKELRVTDDSGAYLVIYVARRADAVYVLHAFQKKTQATPRKEIETAKKRLAEQSRGEE